MKQRQREETNNNETVWAEEISETCKNKATKKRKAYKINETKQTEGYHKICKKKEHKEGVM